MEIMIFFWLPVPCRGNNINTLWAMISLYKVEHRVSTFRTINDCQMKVLESYWWSQYAKEGHSREKLRINTWIIIWKERTISLFFIQDESLILQPPSITPPGSCLENGVDKFSDPAITCNCYRREMFEKYQSKPEEHHLTVRTEEQKTKDENIV